ncbi:MAG: HWE histidine kinase domain-containing protein [Sphingomicrobium sp.]
MNFGIDHSSWRSESVRSGGIPLSASLTSARGAMNVRRPGPVIPDANAIAGDLGFLRSLLDCSADSIAAIGCNGEIRFITPHGLECFGHDEVGPLVGKSWLDLWPADCAELLADGLALALGGQRARRDVRCGADDAASTWWEVSFAPWTASAGDLPMPLVVAIARDVTDRHQATQNAELLARELHHRVRNMLSMVQAIIRISADTCRSAGALIDSVELRIDALARTHALLTDGGQQGETALAALLEAEISPFNHDRRATFAGPHAAVREPQASALSLAIHELTTNAVKFGALSCPEGRLQVSWTADADGQLKIWWVERGGPRPACNDSPGFGSMLLESLLGDQLRVDRQWRDAGLAATIIVPPADPALPASG